MKFSFPLCLEAAFCTYNYADVALIALASKASKVHILSRKLCLRERMFLSYSQKVCLQVAVDTG